MPQGTINDGVITAGNLSLRVDNTWSAQEINGGVYFVPSDYLVTGNNLNIIITQKDDSISLITKDVMEQAYATMYEGVEITTFEHTKITGCEAVVIELTYDVYTLAQIMITGETEKLCYHFHRRF